MTRIHVASHLSEEHLAQIRSVAPDLQVSYQPFSPYGPAEGQAAVLGDVEVLLGYHVGFPMVAAPKLRWLQLTSGGTNHLRGKPILQSDVLITNARVFAAPITEYVFASILAFNRLFPKMHERFQVGRAWPTNQWEEYAGPEVAGKTMAILGYGSIGRQVARVAHAFDMQVIATRRRLEAPTREDSVEVYPSNATREVLARADVAVVCLPLTEETEGSIGAAELRAMKRSAYLVNVGRGKVIQDGPLYQALKEGWIAGAGLDVWAETPLPADSPYFDLPNVIMTPHMSGVSQGYAPRLVALFRENLRRYLAGEPLLNVVDRQQGY